MSPLKKMHCFSPGIPTEGCNVKELHNLNADTEAVFSPLNVSAGCLIFSNSCSNLPQLGGYCGNPLLQHRFIIKIPIETDLADSCLGQLTKIGIGMTKNNTQEHRALSVMTRIVCCYNRVS